MATRPELDLYAIAAMTSTLSDTATSVLRFANSSYVGSLYPVGTVRDAVVRIGCRQVAAITMATLTRDVVEEWGVPEMWEGALAAGRAAKMIGRITGLPHSAAEELFVAGLFSCTGAIPLLAEDPGYLVWRSGQRRRGLSDVELLHRERMAFEMDHVLAAARMLDEWNFPIGIIEAIAGHHEPRTQAETALRAGMTVLGPDSPARCHDESLASALGEMGLGDHVNAVRVEALRYVEALRPEANPSSTVEVRHEIPDPVVRVAAR